MDDKKPLRNRKLILIGGVILMLLLALLFFSKTIYNYSLPAVTGVSPKRGRLSKVETAAGIVAWSGVENIYAEFGGNISEILISEGDRVNRGQPLMVFNYNIDDLNAKIRDLDASREKLKMDIDSIMNKKEKAYSSMRKLDGSSESNYELTQIRNRMDKREDDYKKAKEQKTEDYERSKRQRDTAYEREMAQKEKEFEKIARKVEDYNDALSKLETEYNETKRNKEEEYEKQKLLYEAGAVAKRDFDVLTEELESLTKNYNDRVRELTDAHDSEIGTSKDDYEYSLGILAEDYGYSSRIAEEDYISALARLAEEFEYDWANLQAEYDNKLESQAGQLNDYDFEIDSYNRELRLKEIDLAANAEQLSKYKGMLSDYTANTVFYAPEDCTVISVPFNRGQNVNENQLLLSFGLEAEYKIECEVSLENNFIEIGDTCRLSNATNSLTGVVSRISPNDRVKVITVSVDPEQDRAGKMAANETYDIRFEKQSTEQYLLIPNGALNRDGDGYFVYTIERRKGIMGNEYFVRKESVYIGDSDSENTVVTSSLNSFRPVVLLSSKPFSEKDTVRITNEGDFFAD